MQLSADVSIVGEGPRSWKIIILLLLVLDRKLTVGEGMLGEAE